LTTGTTLDIKPDNILLARDATGHIIAKVADFGLAQCPTSTTPNITRSMCGTPGYIAPELSRGYPFTSECDIFSLGVTTVELLTGTKNYNNLATIKAPKLFIDFVYRMTHATPSRRPSIQDIARVLNILLRPVQAPIKKSDQGNAIGKILLGAAVVGLVALLASGNNTAWEQKVKADN